MNINYFDIFFTLSFFVIMFFAIVFIVRVVKLKKKIKKREV